MKNFSLTVIVTTFKHELFLKDCLLSIINQKTDFPFKVIIGEDASPDNTKDIVKDFHAKYPHIFVPILFENNVGSHKNFMTCLEHCNSEWIAIVEGDDFWTDPYKLQKQAEILVKNPKATLCFSLATSLIESSLNTQKVGRVFGPEKSFFKKIYTRNDFLISNIAPTCTVVFKREAAQSLPDWYTQWHLGDWTLYLHVLKEGTAEFLNEATACYRIHGAGVWSSISAKTKFEKQISLIKFLINEEPNQTEKKILYLNLLSQQVGLIITHIKNNNLKEISALTLDALTSLFKAKWSYYYFKFYIQKFFIFLNYLKKDKAN